MTTMANNGPSPVRGGRGVGAMTIPIPVRFMMILKTRPVMDEPALNQNSAGLRTAA